MKKTSKTKPAVSLDNKFLKSIEKISVHDYLCLIYKNKDDQFAAIIPFIRIGLERGEKCIYIADDNTVAEVLTAMRAGGIDTDSYVEKGALLVISKKESCLRHGYFDPDETIEFFKETLALAKKEGYSALRVTGEMTWAIGGEPGTERVMEYEEKLNKFLLKNDCLVVCQYNKSRFNADMLIDAIRTHPIVIAGGTVCRNSYYISAGEFLKKGKATYEEVERLLNALIDHEHDERDLEENEKKYRTVFEDSFDGVFITSPAGKILDINKRGVAMFGYKTKEEMMSLDLAKDVYANPEDRKRILASVNKNGFAEYEITVKKKNGEIMTTICSLTATKNNKGEIVSYHGVIHDITKRKRTEMELVRTSRALQMVSEINQGLIRIADEIILMNEACRIVVKTGGYRLAWIGFAEQDEAKTVRPMAHAGFGTEYVKIAHITWANNEHGRGPTGTAIRTGKTQVSRNISENPKMTPWRQAAMEHGYKSSIALPLTSEGKTFGTLNIYSVETDVFNDKEIKILEELAGDLAFGITSIRKKAECEMLENELLKESTNKYKALFMSSRDAVMTLEPPSWKFTSGNPATVKMFGTKSEKDFLRYEPWKLSPELQPDGRDSAGKAKEMIERAMKEGSNFFEWTHKRVNGEEFPAEVLLSKVTDGRDYLHALVRDITVRKQAEKQLKEYAEEKFKAVFDNANDGMLLADAETKKFSLANNILSKMTGYSLEEIKELKVNDIHPKEDLPHVLDQFEKQRKRELSVAENLPVKRKDGSVFYADISSSPVTIGGRVFVLGIFRDITERKHTEIELSRMNRTLRMLNDANQSLVRITDEKALLDKISQIVVDIGGYSLMWIGFAEQNAAKIVCPVAQAGFGTDYLKFANVTWGDDECGRGPTGTAIRTGKTQVARDISKDPKMTPWRQAAVKRGYKSSIALPLTNEGQTFGALNIYAGEIDAFNEKEIEILEELAEDLAFGITTLRLRKKVEDRTKEVNQLKNKFIQIVSHQLRTPLNVIRWNLETILDRKRGEVSPSHIEMLREMYAADMEIISRLNDLLIAMDIEEGRMKLDIDTVEIGELLESVCEEKLQPCQLKNITYEIIKPKMPIPPIQADAEKIRDVVTRLIDNAITYTNDGGHIVVKFLVEATKLRFEISDTGVGIPASEQPRIFERFHRGWNASQMKTDASGLSLFISKHYIDEHHGTIGFSSTEKKKSTFWFELPIA